MGASVLRGRPERLAGAEIGDYLGLPSMRRRGEGRTWDATLVELPENQCREHGSDYGWRGPSALRIWKEVDKATQKVIAYHTHLSAYGAEQTIWMDGRPHPPDYARHTWEGFRLGIGRAIRSSSKRRTSKKIGLG